MNHDYHTDDPRSIDPESFRVLGVGEFAYMKPVVIDGQKAVCVYGADGSELGVVENRNAAILAIREHGMEPVSVH